MYQRLAIIASLALKSVTRTSEPPTYCPNRRMQRTSEPTHLSVSRKNTDVSATITSTMAVVIQTSFQVGHVTFDTSWRTSCMKCSGFFTLGSRSKGRARGTASCLSLLALLPANPRRVPPTQERAHPIFGRGGGSRTPSLRFWRPTLYQLSYTP